MAKRRKKKMIKVRLRALGAERALGLCWQHDNLIEIDERQSSYMFGRVALHEALHAVAGDEWSENRVEKASTLMWDVIWNLNYRRIYDENKPMKLRYKKKKRLSE